MNVSVLAMIVQMTLSILRVESIFTNPVDSPTIPKWSTRNRSV